MRKIGDIVSDAKQGKIPTHEECYWTLLALSGRLHFSQRDLVEISKSVENFKTIGKEVPIGVYLRANNEKKTRESYHKFLNLEPQQYLGDMGNPFNPETIEFREMGDKILKAALKKVEKK